MVKLCVHVFFTPWGHVNFMPIFGTHLRHLGHMTHMLDSDWLKNFLLRSDWLPTEVAMYTTPAACSKASEINTVHIIQCLI